MIVWLDDKRPKPWNYDKHVFMASEAISLLETGKVTSISLDHDLGDKTITGDGYEVACWIEHAAFTGLIPRLNWSIHSQNPVGAKNMRAALERADEFWSHHELCIRPMGRTH